MRDPTIARNYAETLVALASRAGDPEGWGDMMEDVADAVRRDERLRTFLHSPRIGVERKNALLSHALEDHVPPPFLRFLHAVIRHRRQDLIPEIAAEYRLLVDDVVGRVHAHVTVSRPPDQAVESSVTTELSRVLGKTVVPHFAVNEQILGGVVVRVGDTVMDGSVRKRLAVLRARMLGAR
jgi:F-type H+-transporting ATPase subunit delta